MHWIYAHLIGDYLFQTDKMALGKKQSWVIAFLHVITYLIPFLFTGIVWWKLILIGAQHLIQDRTNIIVWFMKIKGSAAFTEPPCGPWSVILTDNIIHILWISFVVSL